MSNIPEAVIEPTKAAIERWHYLVFGDADVSFDEMNRQRRGMIGATEACRYIDQVSDSLKAYFHLDLDKVKQGHLGQFILPDPEPDVLAELLGSDFELTWAGHEASADDLRTELAKRGYAITKTGEAGQ
jgi:hypothetical protein